jgi:hypothetical protein
MKENIRKEKKAQCADIRMTLPMTLLVLIENGLTAHRDTQQFGQYQIQIELSDTWMLRHASIMLPVGNKKHEVEVSAVT